MTPTLTTRRLLLRPLDPADARHFARLFGEDSDAIAMTATLPDPCTEEEAGKWIARRVRDSHGFAICRAGDGVFVGAVGFGEVLDRIEMGYGIGRPFWGNGYATEAVREAVRHARAVGVAALEAYTFPTNPASARVLEKNGFKNMGRITRNYPLRGGQRAVFRYVLDMAGGPKP
ncbi:MAG: GNAT family N-acetyltransferase [Rhodospirillales bacterium]|jgi:RimJ/RimL family protein N-acetyltransferase|nr:GNAT family N-acetyltransferase [Rhodospirillales bacterium]